MAISVVQSKSAAWSSGTTITATLGSNTTAGNCLVVCIMNVGGTAAATVSGVTIGGSASNFSLLKAAHENDSGIVFNDAFIWACPNCPGGQTSVVVTGTNFSTGGGAVSTPAAGIVVYEVSGLASSSVLDAFSTDTGISTSWTSLASGTTTQAAEFIVGCASTFTTLTGPSSPWTNTGVGSFLVAGEQISSATGTFTYSGTQTGNSPWATAVVTLKGVAGTNVNLGTAAIKVAAEPLTLPTILGTATINVAAQPVTPATIIPQLIVSLASQAGTDNFGNPFPQGVAAFVVIGTTVYQVSIGPVTGGGLGLVLTNLTNPASGAPASVQLNGTSLIVNSAQSTGSTEMVMALRESADPAGPGVQSAFFTGSVMIDQISTTPTTVSPVCQLYYLGGVLYAKGSSGTAVALATT